MNPVSPIKRLSNELLTSILEFLHIPENGCQHQPDLANCARINHQWHDVATPLLWRAIHLDAGWKNYQAKAKNPGKSSMAKSGTLPWGCDFPDTLYTNQIGVRPNRLDVLSKVKWKTPERLNHCQYLTILIDRNDMQDLVSILTACPNLRHVDLVMTLKNLPLKLREYGRKIVAHLLNMALSSLRIKYMNQPTVKDFPDTTDRLPVPLFGQITAIAITHPVVDISEILDQLSFPHLKSFTYILAEVHTDVPAKWLTPEENERFWNTIESSPLEELGFSVPYTRLAWNGGNAKFPSRLKRVNVVFDTSLSFNPIPLLQAPNLRSLVVKSRNFWRNEDTFPPVDYDQWERPTEIPYETIACHKLRQLHLTTNGIDASIIPIVFSQCTLLEDVMFPQNTYNRHMTDLPCPSLRHVGFESSYIGKQGLRDLVKIRSLVSIAVVVYQFENILYEQVAVLWAKELPSLQRVIFRSDTPKMTGVDKVARVLSSMGQSLRMDMSTVSWLCSFLREDVNSGEVYLDMQAMRSDENGCLSFGRLNRTRRLSYSRG